MILITKAIRRMSGKVSENVKKREMTDAEEKALDDAFDQMDKAFAEMDKAFEILRKI